MTLSERLRKARSDNALVGEYLILSKAIRGYHDRKDKIAALFNKIPKSDYTPKERDDLLKILYHVSEMKA